MSNEMETRTRNAPRPGTKVSLILAAGFLAVAVYYYTLPTHFLGKDGGLFGCGSPMSPNNSPLGKAQCHIIENQGLHKALLFLALALISALLGTLLFGMDKSEEVRGSRSRLEDEEDDDELDDRRLDDRRREEDLRDDEPQAGRRSRLLAGREERRAEPRHRAESSRSRRPRLGDEDEEPRTTTEEPLVRRASRYDADAFEDSSD